MDEERKNLLVAGVYLGDIALALASVSGELPPHVRDLDVTRLLGEAGEVEQVREEIDSAMPGEPEDGELAPALVRAVLGRAIARGKFLSAVRCLEILGEKDGYIDRYVEQARRSMGERKIGEAAWKFVVAANLDFDGGVPTFQYMGPALHEECASNPENCITRMERENAVLRGLKYLLPSERAHGAISQLPAGEREELLGFVALERDPRAPDFLTDYEKANDALKDTLQHDIGELMTMVKQVEKCVREFADSLGRVSAQGAEQREALERARRAAGGLTKELGGLRELVENWQFHRLARRLEQLVESRDDIEASGRILGYGAETGEGGFASILGTIRNLADQGALDKVKQTEERLLSTQVTMLGRGVHSHEHWQYIRELAFKYPVSPLICCIRRINDRWMVVPVWEAPISQVLRDSIARAQRQSPGR
jgi:hypothetical protein